MTWRSVAKRGVVASCLVALLISGTVTPAASTEPGPGEDRAWIAILLQEREEHGYAVAGSSPASARFIPTTPWAAHSQDPGVAHWWDPSSTGK